MRHPVSRTVETVFDSSGLVTGYTLGMGKKGSKQSPRPTKPRRKAGYSAGEWFMVALGVALLILVVGMVVSSVLEK